MALAKAKWFDYTLYMNNKLAQMQATDPSYTMDQLVAAFNNVGFSGEAGALNHFVKYGANEDVSPNALFNAEYYYESKALQFYQKAGMSADEIKANITLYAANMKAAIHKAGMNAWTHYIKYGTAENVNPSAEFDTKAYMEAKYEAWSKTDAGKGKTIDDMYKAFKDANLNAVEHAVQYGTDPETATEGEAQCWTDKTHTALVEDIASNDDGLDDPNTDGQTFKLTREIDVLTGTAANDIFIGDGNTAQAADQLDGGKGDDTLQLVGGFQALPTITNIEKVYSSQTAAATLDISKSTDVKTLEVDGNTGNQTYTVTTGQSVILENMDSALQVTLAGNTPDELDVTVSKFGKANAPAVLTLDGAAVKTLNVTTADAASAFTLANAPGKLDALNIGGDQSVTITEALTSLKTIDASASTGGVAIKTGAAADVKMTGGSGNDAIWFTAGEYNKSDVVDLGAGDADKLVIADAAMTDALYAAVNAAKNVEVLGINASGNSVDLSKLTNGINALSLENGAYALTTTNSLGTTAYTVNLGTDNASLTIGNKTGETKTGVTIDNQTGAAHSMTALTVTGVTDVALESTGKAGSANTITNLAVSSSSTVTVKGDVDLTITGMTNADATGWDKVDASSFTGKLNVTGTNNHSDILVGGSGDDTLSGGAAGGAAGTPKVSKVISQDVTVTTAPTADSPLVVTIVDVDVTTGDIATTDDAAAVATKLATAVNAAAQSGGALDGVVSSAQATAGTLVINFTYESADTGSFTIKTQPTGATIAAAASASGNVGYQAGTDSTLTTDILTGNGGSDKFVIDHSASLAGFDKATVELTDFTDGADKIVVNGFSSTNFTAVTTAKTSLTQLITDGLAAMTATDGQVWAAQYGNDTYAFVGGGTAGEAAALVKITGVAVSNITADDFSAA